ncbi:hypothetical protein F4821DRAFT_200353 [Hypoxylon rubiginosum]|uniref:Uncharacterized protein n=1 Tax=Hypoxylon rubiginosum TaxID=110542 RepID=A0ACC0DF54_9PEZI|nr:hypothetical protein F4821DRAFT_200353 [Hypoxylon rubiginosum]
MTISPQVTGARSSQFSTQPGSTPKRWDKKELRRCGAIGTTKSRHLNLRGEVHPVFTNWVDIDPELERELEQPLLLASRLLEDAGLPWVSDFLAHDIFTENYPGRNPSCRCSFGYTPPGNSREVVPKTIVRHHRASWATPEHTDEWTRDTKRQLEGKMADALTWQLDADMHREKGWVGYTCRHPRCELPLDELDRYENIEWWDRGYEESRWRKLTILLTTEFPARMAELRRQGKDHSEEYLLTAFMATMTILHELGHAVYWKDRRALTRDLREPYYGADLEMELGDSFVASIFGGWVPVPIKDLTQLREGLEFSNGIAWRQVLSWDAHRLRPKYRAHYSIPVAYVARLFSEESWREAGGNILRDVIRPKDLETCFSGIGIDHQISVNSQYATAARADFHCVGQGWRWNRLPGAPFRIPQYDGYLCPDLDLPIATDDVIEEARPLPPLQPAATVTPATPKPNNRNHNDILISSPFSPFSPSSLEKFPQPPRGRKTNNPAKKIVPSKRQETGGKKTQVSQIPRFVKLAKDPNVLSPDRSEISVDELRCRLSQLLGVSFDELEKFFEASRCA